MSPKWKFILTYGEGWGLAMFVTTIIWETLADHRPFTWATIIIGLVVWPLGGLAFGSFLWDRFERRRRKNRTDS